MNSRISHYIVSSSIPKQKQLDVYFFNTLQLAQVLKVCRTPLQLISLWLLPVLFCLLHVEPSSNYLVAEIQCYQFTLLTSNFQNTLCGHSPRFPRIWIFHIITYGNYTDTYTVSPNSA